MTAATRQEREEMFKDRAFNQGDIVAVQLVSNPSEEINAGVLFDTEEKSPIVLFDKQLPAKSQHIREFKPEDVKKIRLVHSAADAIAQETEGRFTKGQTVVVALPDMEVHMGELVLAHDGHGVVVFDTGEENKKGITITGLSDIYAVDDPQLLMQCRFAQTYTVEIEGIGVQMGCPSSMRVMTIAMSMVSAHTMKALLGHQLLAQTKILKLDPRRRHIKLSVSGVGATSR